MNEEYLILKELQQLLEADQIKYDVINKDIYYYRNGEEYKYYYYDLINDIDKDELKINKSGQLFKVLMAIHNSAIHREFKNEVIKYYLNSGLTLPRHIFIEDGILYLPVKDELREVPTELLVNHSIEIVAKELGISLK